MDNDKKYVMRIDGITILSTDSISFANGSARIEISNVTALLYINKKNVSSYYAETLTVEELADMLYEDCETYGHAISYDEAMAVAEYVKEKIGGTNNG